MPDVDSHADSHAVSHPVPGPATYQPEPYDPGTARMASAPLGGWPGPASPPYSTAPSYGFVLQPRRRSHTGWVASLLVVLAALGFVCWRVASSSGGSGSGAHTVSIPPVPSLTSTPPAAGSPDALGLALAGYALQPADFTNGFTVTLEPAGDQVRGQITLDNCGFRFASEAHRVARRQYEVFDGSGRKVGLSNELVAYDGPTAAALALREWHAAAAHCPAGLLHITPNSPRVRERTLRNDLDVRGLPLRANAVTISAVTEPRSGARLHLVAILLVRGRYLDAIYVTQRRVPTRKDMQAAFFIASLTGNRLAAGS